MDNLAIARRYFIEIMNLAREDVIDEMTSPDCVFTLPTYPEPHHGPEGEKALVKMLHSAFPDFYILPQDMVAHGDAVVTRWRGGGTHIGGPLRTVQGDIPASGKKFEIDGMTWLRIVDGKIVEAIGHEDTVGLLTQLGVIPKGQSGPEPSPEQNRAVVARYFDEVMSQGKMGVVEEICDPNFAFIIPTQPEPVRGYAGFVGFVGYLRNAFPDIKFTVEREIAEGNKVASRWRINGTHKGEFLGAPATGRTIQDYGIDIFTLARGKIVTVHVNENDMGLFQQLGLA